jgi:hypothetical protein
MYITKSITMKLKQFIGTIVLVFVAVISRAQVVSDIKPSAEGKMGEFTAWTPIEVSFDDGTKAPIEYRIRLATRKGIGCHYDLEVVNKSDIKLNVRLKSSYYDKLVKSNFGDEIKETLKPGKGVVGRLVAQGCKKDKGSDLDDYASCLACEFGASIYISK